jgi:transposase
MGGDVKRRCELTAGADPELGIGPVEDRQANHALQRIVITRMSSHPDAAEPRIRELLAEWPDMPATVIAERIGWQRSLTVLKERVRDLRPLFVPPDPASRTAYQPGELAQCDLWFPPADVPLGAGQAGRPPVLVMVAGYSRVMAARMIPSRQSPDLLAGHWALISGLGAVPRSLVWDNESAVGQWRGGRPVLTEAMNGFRGTLGITVIQCRPRDPEAKGLVERANGYLETSFLPGRRFAGPADSNAPVTGWRISTRLPRDHYVRLDSNDYSVHPSVIGRKVEVAAGLEEVTVTWQDRLVARHPRCWAAHQSITDPAHTAAAAQLRQERRLITARPADTDVQQRALSDYDQILGTASDQGAA